MKIFAISLTLVVLFTLVSLQEVFASPETVGLSAFTGSETIITFDSIEHGEEITTQFTDVGATFSGGLFGNTFPFFTGLFSNSDPGNTIACNLNFPGFPLEVFDDITVDFSPPVGLVGFDVITNDVDDTTVIVHKFSGGSAVPTGTLVFDTTDTEDSFIGVQDNQGIDRLVFDAANVSLGSICVNNFRFEVIVPFELKKLAIGRLAPHIDESKQIGEAIKQIEKSLEDDLWIDGFHLDPKDGKKVFKRERKAVKKLMKLYDQEVDDEDTDGGSISSEALASVQRAIDDLLKADSILAEVSLEEATDAPILDPER